MSKESRGIGQKKKKSTRKNGTGNEAKKSKEVFNPERWGIREMIESGTLQLIARR